MNPITREASEKLRHYNPLQVRVWPDSAFLPGIRHLGTISTDGEIKSFLRYALVRGIAGEDCRPRS